LRRRVSIRCVCAIATRRRTAKSRKANFAAHLRQVPRGTFRPRNISRRSKTRFVSAQSSFHILQTIILQTIISIIQNRPLGNVCEFPIFSLNFVRYSIYFPILLVLPVFLIARLEDLSYTY
jgi:hypothetical protein